MKASTALVSVICTTYNQATYIRKALDSILSQKTDFEFELIIHDDASTDGTLDILKEYERSDCRVKCIYENENLYSQNISFIGGIIKDKAEGKYIALCEGDDYWIDERKLQVQFNALEMHPECDMCACWGSTVSENGLKEISQIRPLDHDGYLKLEDVILGGGQYLVTAGLFFNKKMLDDMMGLDALDYSLQIRGALRGNIYYVDRKMAVYRRYAKGSWTNNVLHNKEKLYKQWDREKRVLEKFDKYTKEKYHNIIMERLKAYITFEKQLECSRDDILSDLFPLKHPCFLWGLGRRGRDLEAFLKKESFFVDGVCDAIEANVGEYDQYGNLVVSTDYALKNAKSILASSGCVYNDLIKMNLKCDVLDFQKYMPFG